MASEFANDLRSNTPGDALDVTDALAVPGKSGADLSLRQMRTAATAHLVFVPDQKQPGWFLWGEEAAQSPLAVLAEPGTCWLPAVVEGQLRLRRMRGYRLPMLQGVMQLVSLSQAELQQLPLSQAVWSLAAKLGLELIARQQLVPRISKSDGEQAARWQVVLNLPHDRERVAQLLTVFPVAAHAVPLATPDNSHPPADNSPVWTASALLAHFLDTLADQLVRAGTLPDKRKRVGRPADNAVADKSMADKAWPMRWQRALTSDDAEFVPQGVHERTVLADLRDWLLPVTQAHAHALQLRLTLQPPADDTREFELEFGLQHASPLSAERTAHVSAEALFAGTADIAVLQCDARLAKERLLKELAVAARCLPVVENELRKPQPERALMRPRMVCDFLAQLTALEQAGIAVVLPAALQPVQQQRIKLVMRLGADTRTGTRTDTRAGTSTAADQPGNDIAFVWQAQLANHLLSEADVDALIDLRTPLAKFRDSWVMLDSRGLLHVAAMLKQQGGSLSMSVALSLALIGTQVHAQSGVEIIIEAEGALAELVAQMRSRDALRELPDPPGLQAQLRPYQRRGFSWLHHLTSLGLGACLADDMGLGKTVQLIACLLQQREQWQDGTVLLVCPTSVLGNWERELKRFAPTLPVHSHYGIDRIQNAEDMIIATRGKLVLTSYGLLRRDIDWLADMPVAVCVLDEAQFIKNASAATARAARRVQATRRIALTGTPVENHLTELWSVMEFLNPGLLGPRETFRREIALPIERHGREDVAEKLRRMVAPFILRRIKTDKSVISDLPDKLEHKVYCSLSREQAALYSHAVNEAMLEIEGVDGMTRRGRVLALLTALKQVCNHPAHYLREQGPLAGRSGKFDRLLEMLEQVLKSGDRALVFTQYREMGERLARALTRLHGRQVPFLHGGVSRAARDEMVRRFQEEPRASRLLVISLKAGGTGLNLTAATQVFHFDRWWNPAVEDQATDRAYRIGQQHNVQVYKLLCAGTVEDKIDQMLEAKRDLADRIVRQGEAWISELNNDQLRELFALAPTAVVGDVSDDKQDEETGRFLSTDTPPSRRRRTVADEEAPA